MITTIVHELRPEHGMKPKFTAPPMKPAEPFKKPDFKPFPPGTVRGPFTCGKGTDPRGGVQFCVQTHNGWVYFIKAANERSTAESEARTFAANVKSA